MSALPPQAAGRAPGSHAARRRMSLAAHVARVVFMILFAMFGAPAGLDAQDAGPQRAPRGPTGRTRRNTRRGPDVPRMRVGGVPRAGADRA